MRRVNILQITQALRPDTFEIFHQIVLEIIGLRGASLPVDCYQLVN